VQPVARYRDPIKAQEVDQMDYLTSYPPEKEISNTGAIENRHEESDKPAMDGKRSRPTIRLPERTCGTMTTRKR